MGTNAGTWEHLAGEGLQEAGKVGSQSYLNQEEQPQTHGPYYQVLTQRCPPSLNPLVATMTFESSTQVLDCHYLWTGGVMQDKVCTPSVCNWCIHSLGLLWVWNH